MDRHGTPSRNAPGTMRELSMKFNKQIDLVSSNEETVGSRHQSLPHMPVQHLDIQQENPYFSSDAFFILYEAHSAMMLIREYTPPDFPECASVNYNLQKVTNAAQSQY
ncbi:hypothetical protein JTB14_017669 [Gonioctena quinquepunctata]|nr:hypothetical protein JTB14_017669 [Gonioctena quinquepunctata]